MSSVGETKFLLSKLDLEPIECQITLYFMSLLEISQGLLFPHIKNKGNINPDLVLFSKP